MNAKMNLSIDLQTSIRRSYDAVLSTCARLSTFATARPMETDTDVNERQESLAIDDLIFLSIHGRRLLSDTDVTGKAKITTISIEIPVFAGPDVKFQHNGETISVWRILGAIVHHRELRVIRDMFAAKLFWSGEFDERAMRIDFVVPQFNAKILLESDKQSRILIDLESLMSKFVNELVEDSVSWCEERGLFLRLFHQID